MIFVPHEAPLSRPGGVTRGREVEWERRCGAWAAAVMDAWVRFSAQSQARERLCRCGSSKNEVGEGGQTKTVVRRGRFTLRGQKGSTRATGAWTDLEALI